MLAKTTILFVVGIVIAIIHHANSHGYLADPPSRSSAWRLGFKTPINYEDNQLFCGGFDVRFYDIINI